MRRFAVVLLMIAALSPRADAIDFVVTRTDDPLIVAGTLSSCSSLNGCSLRQAVLAANKRAGADRVVLGRDVYDLSQTTASDAIDGRRGPLKVTDTLIIVGSAPARTRIRWRTSHGQPHMHQVLVTDPGVWLTLQALTVADGRGRYGGCLRTWGDLTLDDVVIEGCQGERGGAAEIGGAVVTLRNAILRNNQATGSGGALRIGGATTIIADGAQLIGNTALGDGGAISGAGAFGISPSAPAVWRNQGAASVFSGNGAGGNGGAVSVSGFFGMNFYVYPAGGPRIVFEHNVADGHGGAISVDPGPGSIPGWNRLTLEDALLRENAAGSGGAIASQGDLTVFNSEFTGNVAQDALTAAGRGGALMLGFNNASQIGTTWIQRSSFHGNSARGNGGAIASDCQTLNLINVSLADNLIHGGQGTAIAASGGTALAHVTTGGHNPPGAAFRSTLAKLHHTACSGRAFTLTNSIVGDDDNCQALGIGSFTSNGGNQYGPQAGGCYMIAGLDAFQHDAAIFGLSSGLFGGAQKILGWNDDGVARPQVGFGVSAHCSAEDVCGLPRDDGACDSGAFEQQPPGSANP